MTCHGHVERTKNKRRNEIKNDIMEELVCLIAVFASVPISFGARDVFQEA